MKPTRTILVLVAIAAVGLAIASLPLFATTDATDAEKAPSTEAAPSEEVQEPTPSFAKDPEPEPVGCEVERDCAYPPPASISCYSFENDCSEGSEGYGWVECDGHRTYCSAPSCSGHGTPCIKDANCDVDVCTCGPGFCDAQGSCYCPDEPQ